MCSFVGIKTGPDFRPEHCDMILDLVDNLLEDKGGDISKLMIHHVKTNEFSTLTITDIDRDLDSNESDCCKLVPGDTIFGFSRLTPEMETNDVSRESKIPPYKTLFGKYIATHGTIPLKDIDIDMIDTEILKFEETLFDSLRKVEKLNGKVSILEYDPELREFNAIHNGLGLSEIRDGNIFTGITNKIFDKSWDYDFLVREIEPNRLYSTNYNGSYMPRGRSAYTHSDEVIVSLCSGGMDIMVSTMDVISKTRLPKLKAVHFDYFNWGTRATLQEIDAVGEFAKYVCKKIITPSNPIQVFTDVIPAKNYFKEILNFANLDKTRLNDPDAVGMGQNESEEAISYVPLRNTFLIMALVAKYEALYPNMKVTFVIGGNLTEGMVYSDNSVNYIAKMNQLIKLAGQKTSNFQLVAPFAKMTKTKMLETYLESYSTGELSELLNLSFSCYFPEDGKACGKCGSCLLKDISIKNAGYIKMDGKWVYPAKIPNNQIEG